MSLKSRARPSKKDVAIHYKQPYEEGTLLHYLRFDTLKSHLVAYDAMKDLLFDAAESSSAAQRLEGYKLYLLQVKLPFRSVFLFVFIKYGKR